VQLNTTQRVRIKKENVEVDGFVGLESTIKHPVFGRSPVDIIVPFHGQYKRLITLIESVLRVRSNPYLLTLVDDGSPNPGFLKQLEKVPQLNRIRLDEQVGFGAALQAGFQATKQPFVMFMHSDCEALDPSWMLSLGQTLIELEEKGVGMVSARSDNPFCDDTRFEGKLNSTSEHVILESGESMPLYCAMCRRGLFNKIGGFIKSYPFAMYEDQELSYRMGVHGVKQAISGTSWIKHHANATISEVSRSNPLALGQMEKNYDRCVADMKACLPKK
jgi:GT2 family glycosyltransferase